MDMITFLLAPGSRRLSLGANSYGVTVLLTRMLKLHLHALMHIEFQLHHFDHLVD